MPLDLSVIITTYNSADVLPALLSSIAALPPDEAPSETIVVDNDSSDHSVSIAGEFPGVRIIRSPKNLGLATANNMGARSAGGASLFFINPDTIILPGALAVLADFERAHPNAGLVGPAMFDMEDELQSTARSFPSIIDVVLRRTPLGRTSWGETRLRKHLFPPGIGSAPLRVDWLVGAAMWLTAAGRKRFGLMCERYFLYFEDVEWCWRAAESGMEVWYLPEAGMRHVCSRESAESAGPALWHHLRSGVRFFCEHPSLIF